MKIFYYFVISAVLIFTVNLGAIEESSQNNREFTITSISIFELLARPENFHQSGIQVAGVFHYNGQFGILYPSKEYYNEEIISSSITIEISKNLTIEKMLSLMELDGQYVHLRGVFFENEGLTFTKGMIKNIEIIAKSSNVRTKEEETKTSKK